MGSEVVFFSRFVFDENAGGGGCKREAQLCQALRPLKYTFMSFRDSPWALNQVSRWENFMFKMKKKYHPYKNYWFDFYIDSVFRMRAAARQWEKYVAKSKKIKCAIIDDPIYFYPLVEYLYRKKIPIVGLCQNIESLSYSQLSHRYQIRLFNKEIKLYKKCALIVTISKEETYILKNFNIPTFFLPYYPVESIEERMLQVRKKRKRTRKKGFLLLGTAGNKVTLDGMTAFIDFWKSSNNKNKKEKLLVAGYWTKELLKVEGGENVQLLGSISNERLDAILGRIKAMVCYQEYGSGALTKIREMLIAGVPVLANNHAARSYHGHAGVVEFSGFADIARAAAQVEKLDVPLPTDMDVETLNRDLLNKINASLGRQFGSG